MWASVPRPCSSQADGQVWKECICWQEFDGARGTNGSHVLTRPLSALGEKNHGGGGRSAGRGVQNKLSQFLQAAACQWIPTMASDSVSTEARKMVEVKWPVGGKGNLHYKSGTSLPWIYSPKEGHFPAHTVSQTQLHPNCDVWCSLCFCV